MSEKINDGGPAFPVLYGQTNGLDGMSLRDWFAGQALAGLLASGVYSNSGPGFESFIALKSFYVADAMLAAAKAEESTR